MRNMIIRAILPFCLLLLGSSAYGGYMVESLYSSQELLVNKVSREIADELSNRHKIYFSGSGGDINEKIKKLSLSFNCFRELKLEEARGLLINCAEMYLKEINSNNELKEYLHARPFTAKDIELTIYIFNADGRNLDIDHLCVAGTVYGEVQYKKWKSEYSMEKILVESFEEAVRIVREGK
ncbi:MAG: hypothetical protein KFB93_01535 [Simkaniaceae bacterium]|nr:MAG: hypothetical protein KFB93_01535 [Simkaniaceae bacterium]